MSDFRIVLKRHNKLIMRVVCLLCVFTFSVSFIMEPAMQAEAAALTGSAAWLFFGLSSLVGISGITMTKWENQTKLTDNYFEFQPGLAGRMTDLYELWFLGLSATAKNAVQSLSSVLSANGHRYIEVTDANVDIVNAAVDSVRAFWFDNYGITSVDQYVDTVPVESTVTGQLYILDADSAAAYNQDYLQWFYGDYILGSEIVNGKFFPTHYTNPVHFIEPGEGVLSPHFDDYCELFFLDSVGTDGIWAYSWGPYLEACRSLGLSKATFLLWPDLVPGLHGLCKIVVELGEGDAGDSVVYYGADYSLTTDSSGVSYVSTDWHSICTMRYQQKLDAFGIKCTNWDSADTRNDRSLRVSCWGSFQGSPGSTANLYDSLAVDQNYVANEFATYIYYSWQSQTPSTVVEGTSALAWDNADATDKIIPFPTPSPSPDPDDDGDEDRDIPFIWFPPLPKREVDVNDPSAGEYTVVDPNQYVYNDFAEFSQDETLNGYRDSGSGGSGSSDRPDYDTNLAPPVSLGIDSIWHYVADTFDYCVEFFEGIAAVFHYVPRPVMYLAWANVVLIIVFGVYKRLIT